MAPKSVVYGLAGGKVAANRFSNFFRNTNSDAPTGSKTISNDN